MQQSGFLGTDASFITDFTLLAEIILFLGLCAGVVAQRRSLYKLHDWIQTPVVVLNLFLIIFVMVASFIEQQVISTLPQRPDDPYYLVVALHAGLGLTAEGLAIYVLLAGHKILPRKIGRLRYWMWATFGFWTAAFIAGITTYYIWYVQPPAVATLPVPDPGAGTAETAGGPTTTQVFLQNFAFTPVDLSVIAGSEVIWLNQDGAPHNVAFVDGSVASDNFFQGESFANTFGEPGTFQIYCTLHGSPDGSGMSATMTVLADSPENAAVVAAVPTPNPVPPTPTPAPTVPPPPVALLEPPTPAQSVVGLLSFFDTTTASDSVLVFLSDIALPAGNSQFEAWLTDSQTSGRFSLGIVAPDANGQLSLRYTDGDGRNLLGLFDGFQLTEEPQFDDDPSPGPIVVSGQQVPDALARIRAITVSDSEAPQPFGFGARLQTEELLRHVGHVRTAFDSLSIADAQRHTEHIVNLLDGEQGEAFGDLDGLHGVQNPGDNFGIIPYVTQMQAAAEQAAAAPGATEAIQVHSTHVVMATDNALIWATQIREAALQIIAAASVSDIGPQVETMVQNGQLLLNGADSNGDGEIAPGEGGIFTAYQHAQYMAAIPVVTY